MKRYRRAADGRAETAADVRSLVWLERTVTHLWQVVRGVLAEASGHEEEKGEGIQVEKNVSCYVELYDFVSDRFMAVRKDMILQGLSGLEARRIYQRIIRFHIFFDYLLTQQVNEKFGRGGCLCCSMPLYVMLCVYAEFVLIFSFCALFFFSFLLGASHFRPAYGVSNLLRRKYGNLLPHFFFHALLLLVLET